MLHMINQQVSPEGESTSKNPSHDEANLVLASSLPDVLRKFLFIKNDVTGKEEPLSSATGFFVSLLLATPEHRQSMCVLIGELQAVLGGLLLAVALNHKLTAREEAVGWSEKTTAADWMDGVAVLSQILLTVTCMVGFAASIVAAAAGTDKDMHFYAGIIDALGLGMMFMFVGVQLTISILCYDAFKSSHPLPATIFVTLGVAAFILFSWVMSSKVFAQMPLEVYHMPNSMVMNMKAMTGFHKNFDQKRLEEDGRKEALALRRKHVRSASE